MSRLIDNILKLITSLLSKIVISPYNSTTYINNKKEVVVKKEVQPKVINTIKPKIKESTVSYFDVGLKKVLKCEGGYVNDPDDRGGETYRGVARKFWGTWKGWDIIDEIQETRPMKFNEIIKNDDLDLQIAEFYRKNFWRKSWDKCATEVMATEIMEAYVNYGSFVFKLIQRALNDTLGYKRLTEDGKYGRKTDSVLLGLDKSQADVFLTNFDKRRVAYIDAIIAHRPTNAKFRKGWLKRIFKR